MSEILKKQAQVQATPPKPPSKKKSTTKRGKNARKNA